MLQDKDLSTGVYIHVLIPIYIPMIRSQLITTQRGGRLVFLAVELYALSVVHGPVPRLPSSLLQNIASEVFQFSKTN